jgi:diguanylate cyclase (GGDEF)-like protein/PAS domain S-box-containing protein
MPTAPEQAWLALTGREARPDDVVSAIHAALGELPDASVTVFDRDLRLLLVRGTVLSSYGIDPSDLEGGIAPEVLEPHLWDFLRPLYETALRGEQAAAELTSPDGRRHFKLRVGPVRGHEAGTVLGGVAIATDVSEEFLALQALADSEERYRLLAENSSDMVMRTTPDGIIEWISPTITKVVGWSPDEMIGTRSLDLAHPDYVALVMSATTQVNAGASVTGRLQVRCKDGTYRWMLRTMRPLLNDDGAVIARVSGWHDVQREVEAERALQQSEEQFRLAMDTSAIGMFFADDRGAFLRVNPAFCRMLGYSAEQLSELDSDDVTHPDDLRRSHEHVGAMIAGDEPVLRLRKRYVARTGAVVWADVTSVVVRGHDGRLVHIIGQVVDVSAEVANFEALQRAAHEFQMLAENASDVVYRSSVDGLFEWVSPSMANVLGWEPSTLVGTPSTALIVAEDRAIVQQRREDLLTGRHGGPIVVRFMTSTGEVREMSGTTHPVVDAAGTVVGYIVGLRDVTEEQRIRRELAYRASHDSLTGVANRDDLMTRLRRRLAVVPERTSGVGVLFVDVDELKAVNDDHGHAAGDAVLAAVATRLVSCVRAQDVVARLGGDEFVVVLNDVVDQDRLTAIAEKCRTAVSVPIEVDGKVVDISVSVGGVLATAYDDADDVLKRADAAVYRAKHAGRDQVSLDVAPP